MAKDKHAFSILLYNNWIDKLRKIAHEQDRSVNYLIVKAVEKTYELTGDC